MNFNNLQEKTFILQMTQTKPNIKSIYLRKSSSMEDCFHILILSSLTQTLKYQKKRTIYSSLNYYVILFYMYSSFPNCYHHYSKNTLS